MPAMNRDDWAVLGDRCAVLVCAVAIFLYATGVIR